MMSMQRRNLITFLGATIAVWPRISFAQRPEMPVIGFVSSSNPSSGLVSAFHQGLNQGGYFPDRNTKVEYRSAGGRYDELPELFADLIHSQIALIVASGGLVSALAAKGATKTVPIPILFIAGFDPVQVGLVTSLSHPGGNATGVSVYT